MARFGCMGCYRAGGRFVQEASELKPLRLKVAVPRSSTLLGTSPVVDYSVFRFTDQLHRFDWQLLVTPTLEPPVLNLQFYRWSLRDKEFVVHDGNLLDELNITLVYSFDRVHEVVWSCGHFYFKPAASCLLPRTKFLVHIFEIDSFLRP